MSKYLIEVEIPKAGIFEQAGLGHTLEKERARVKVIVEELLLWLADADIYTAMTLTSQTNLSLKDKRQETKEQFIKTVSHKLKEMGIE